MLVWSDIYSTGYALVDTQHKILLDKLNELELRLEKGELAKEEIDALLQFLGNYARTHFSYEEHA